VGGQCEMVKQTGRRSPALLSLGPTGDKGERVLTWGSERNWGRQVRRWAARSAATGVAQLEHWPSLCALEIPQVGLGPCRAGPDS
jgi:hypothetical protein